MENNSNLGLSGELDALRDAWRILDHFGLLDTIFNHISSVINSEGQLTMIINPSGMLPQEVESENFKVLPLRKYTSKEAIDCGVNPDGLQLHSQIHSIRRKPGVVIHTHSTYSLAVGCSKHGFLPLSQYAIEIFDEIKLVDYRGVFRSQELTEQLEQLAHDGGLALLRNHGTLIVSDTLAEAVYLAYYMEEACRIQAVTLAQGVPVVCASDTVTKATGQVFKSERREVAEQLFNAFRRNINRLH